MRVVPLGFSVALALSAIQLSTAGATTMRHLDTRDLTLRSSDIVVGQIEATRPRWSADRKKIFTDVDIRVTQSIKGSDAQRLTLTQLGGELDGIKYSIQGGPLFHSGEQALLFVWRDASGKAQVNGLAQGKFDIQRDAKSGALTVQRSAPGFAVRDVKRLQTLEAGEAAPRIPLDDLVREIQRVMMMKDGAGR